MTRTEQMLQAILNDTSADDAEIISRVDEYLSACCNKSGCTGLKAPITRIDNLLYEKGTTGGNKLPIILGGQATVLTADDLEGVTALRDYAFEYYNALQSIVIPDSVTSIGVAAFHSCYYLTSVTIPSGVESLPANLFANAGTGGDGITISMKRGTPPSIETTTFQGAIIAKIVVPFGCANAYKTAWTNYADYIEESSQEASSGDDSGRRT